MGRFAILGLLLAAMPAQAAEQPVELAPGPNRDTVEQNCGICHSLDYIRMNAPFLSADGWAAEVAKMRAAYGAPIGDADAAAIRTYLGATYSVPAR